MSGLRPLNVLQLNVARSNLRIHAILNDSAFSHIDIFILQEPWFGRVGVTRSDTDPNGVNLGGAATSAAWELFLPGGPLGPGVATYIRRGLDMTVTPRLDIANHPNILITDLKYGNKVFRLANVYNRGGNGSETIGALLECELDPGIPTAVAGDFNLHHKQWSLYATRNERSGEDLLEWALSNGLQLQNDATPTRRGQGGQNNSIIDLTFFNCAAIVDESFLDHEVTDDSAAHLGSDHNALTWSIDVHAEQVLSDRPPTYKINTALRNQWLSEFRCLVTTSSEPDLASVEGVDRESEVLLDAMAGATRAVMPARHPHAPVCSPWWDEECADALRLYRNAIPAKRQALRDAFRRRVRRSKQEFFDTLLVGATPAEVWRYAEWTKGRRCKATPPITGPDGLMATTPNDKCRVFAQTFFPDHHSHVDPHQPDDPPALPRRTHHHVTIDEIRTALKDTSNTSAPGLSGSNYRLLKWAFDCSPERIQAFYSACLRLGHHPGRFRAAAVPAVPKPRKTDMSSPRSYRPIALLECMGKLLEKIVAARILFEVGKHGLLPSNQFGSRDKSSVIDAGLTLVHDVQTAWKKNLVLSALAFDIKGFFDHVNHDRLAVVLEKLGFTQEMCAWVCSFLSDRTVSIRVDGFTADPVPASCGIPQGSPVSPILAALYTSFMFRAVADIPGATLLAYVDDGLLEVVSNSLTSNTNTLRLLYVVCVDYLKRVGLSTDDDKTEMMHFSNRKSDPSPSIFLPRTNSLGEITISARSHMRWLGIFFDRKLKFKQHVEIMATRAHSTVAGLRMLANSVRGMSFMNLRLLYKTVVLPVLIFGAAVWYTGQHQKLLTNVLQRAQNAALRHISGAFRTTPVASLHHITSILPIDLHLSRTLETAAIRLRTLPRSSQPLLRLPAAWDPQQGHIPVSFAPRKETAPHSNLLRLAARTDPAGERLQPYTLSPWERGNSWGERLVLNGKVPSTPELKIKRIAEVEGDVATASRCQDHLVVFTDGSRHAPHRRQKYTGAAYAIFHRGRKIASCSYGLGRHAGVFDAEMAALAGAARRAAELVALSLPSSFQEPVRIQRSSTDTASTYLSTPITRIDFYVDNTSAITSIYDPSPHPAQLFSLMFRDRIDSALRSCDNLKIQVSWAPAHKGIKGNEHVDELAKAAVTLSPPLFSSTISWAKEQAKTHPAKLWRKRWLETPHQNLSAVALRGPPSPIPWKLFKKSLSGGRDSTCRLVQALTGHCFAGSYYRRFRPTDPTGCPCGQANLQTREHIIRECPLHSHARHHLYKVSPNLDLPVILGSPAGLEAFAAFISASAAFSKPSMSVPPDPFSHPG